MSIVEFTRQGFPVGVILLVELSHDIHIDRPRTKMILSPLPDLAQAGF